MYKENGRLKPADSKETAHSTGKTYECKDCGHSEPKDRVEFGTTYPCPKCNGVLVEAIDM